MGSEVGKTAACGRRVGDEEKTPKPGFPSVSSDNHLYNCERFRVP